MPSPEARRPEDELFRTIASLDRAVFDAYNRCDLEKLGPFFAEDLDFYHDKGGLTRSRQSLVEAIWLITRVISYDHGPPRR
jgi:hypothetical protein